MALDPQPLRHGSDRVRYGSGNKSEAHSKGIRLVLIDVDGTLVASYGVPDCAWVAADKARTLGIHLGICTGRPGRGKALEFAERLDPGGIHIFENGAVLLDGHKQIVHATPLPHPAYAFMIDLARQHGQLLEAYTAEGGYYTELRNPLLEGHEGLLGLKAEQYPLQGVPGLGTLTRAQWVVQEGPAWQAVRGAVLSVEGISLHEATSPITPGTIYASMTSNRVSKLSGAAWLAEHYGVGLEQVAMVGDGENDIEVIRGVGLGIAMGNSPDSVKQAARRVVGHVDECGLAEALELAISTHAAQ